MCVTMLLYVMKTWKNFLVFKFWICIACALNIAIVFGNHTIAFEYIKLYLIDTASEFYNIP